MIRAAHSHLTTYCMKITLQSGASIICLLALAALSGCAHYQTGIALKGKKNAHTPLVDTDERIPKPNLTPVFSHHDRVRVQILPQARAGGLVLEPFDALKIDMRVKGGEYRIMPGDELILRFASPGRPEWKVVVRPDGQIPVSGSTEVTALKKTPMELATAVNEALRGEMKEPSTSVIVSRSNLDFAEFSGQVVIQDDGMINLPRVGRRPAAGLAVAELSQALSAAASDFFGSPIEVEVSRELPPFDRQREGLVGFDRSLAVSAEGQLALPEIGPVVAAGRTPQEVREEIEEKLRGRYRNLMTVAVLLEASESRVVYVGGEVGRPGAYPLSAGMTIMRALTLAGGSTDTAELRNVILIHRTKNRDVNVFVTNLRSFLEDGATENDLSLSSQDIVLVYKSRIAKVNLWVDQYITRLLPFSRSVNYSYSQGEVAER